MNKRLTHTDAERIDLVITDIWNTIFTILDNEPYVSGEEAGEYATLACKALRTRWEADCSVDVD